MRERLRAQFDDPRAKLSFQIMAYGNAVAFVWAGPTIAFGLLTNAVVLGHGTPTQKLLTGFTTYRIWWILLAASWIFNGLIAVLAFRQLRRLEARQRASEGKGAEAF